jgi:hypothetical protein
MRVRPNVIFSLAAICLLSGCREGKPVERTTLDSVKSRAVLGKALIGIDDRSIVLCDNRQACAESPDRVCALEMNDRVGNALRAFRGHVGGEYWIAGHAMVVSPGHFGHVGQHPCLVTFNDVTNVDDGPPRLWTPPPPSKSIGR